MRPLDVKALKYRDNLASKRRQRFQAKAGLFIVGTLVLLAGLGYALFYSPWIQVTSVAFEGVTEQHQNEVRPTIDTSLGRKILGVPVGRSILFVRAGALKADLAQQFPFLKEVSVEKDYLHTLRVMGTERQAEGVWCFNASSPAPQCRYFDHGGVLWGQAIQSSGSLLLNVDDERVASGSIQTVDTRFLEAVQLIVPTLKSQGVQAKRVVIPAGSFTEVDIIVSEGYPVKFSIDSDLSGQLKVYQIFRNQRLASGGLKPQYLDLRFDGRVYFK